MAKTTESRRGLVPGNAPWLDLLRGGHAAPSAVVGGGVVLHAVNVFIVATILPSVVHDIGGLRYFAWSTTLYVVASLFGAIACARLLGRSGARWAYRAALATFALGTLMCALAPSMGVLLAGRFVQGLGAGTLSALSFTQVRALFPERLWLRALALISIMWGMATLLGPAVGGVFAQFGAWRAAFWTLLAITPLFALLVEASLPRVARPGVGVTPPMAWLNLALLTVSVVAISVGSMALSASGNLAGLAVAAAGLALFVRRERHATPRLLPHGACYLAHSLGATYAVMLLLLIGLTVEIFVPYFLQTLHGLSPLHAGYVSALLSFGWTVGSTVSSGGHAQAAGRALASGPLVVAAGLLGLAMLMPQSGAGGLAVAAMAACLLAMGLGIGLCWPYLGARVFSSAMEGEHALAASSITTVVMIGNALGSALGGMVTNMAGLSAPGGVAGAVPAAAWLFGAAMLAPVLAAVVVRRRVAIAGAAATA